VEREGFVVETSGGRPNHTEQIECDTYPEAVQVLTDLAADREGKGWNVKQGIASRDNFAAVECTHPSDTRTIIIQVVRDSEGEGV
jgi:hypothetical protein